MQTATVELVAASLRGSPAHCANHRTNVPTNTQQELYVVHGFTQSRCDAAVTCATDTTSAPNTALV